MSDENVNETIETNEETTLEERQAAIISELSEDTEIENEEVEAETTNNIELNEEAPEEAKPSPTEEWAAVKQLDRQLQQARQRIKQLEQSQQSVDLKTLAKTDRQKVIEQLGGEDVLWSLIAGEEVAEKVEEPKVPKEFEILKKEIEEFKEQQHKQQVAQVENQVISAIHSKVVADPSKYKVVSALGEPAYRHIMREIKTAVETYGEAVYQVPIEDMIEQAEAFYTEQLQGQKQALSKLFGEEQKVEAQKQMSKPIQKTLSKKGQDTLPDGWENMSLEERQAAIIADLQKK